MSEDKFMQILKIVTEEIHYASNALKDTEEETYGHGYIDGLLQVCGRVMGVLDED